MHFLHLSLLNDQNMEANFPSVKWVSRSERVEMWLFLAQRKTLETLTLREKKVFTDDFHIDNLSGYYLNK